MPPSSAKALRTRNYSEVEIQNMVNRILYSTTVQDPVSLTPVFVLNSTALPSPTAVDYNLLLPRMLSVLHHAGEYTIVFFAGGGLHRPSWPWMIHTYSTLNRDLRKNLKRLYIVHENWWVRTIMEMVAGAVSGKFRKKAVHITDLSALGNRLNISALSIPLAVYDHNRKLEPFINFPQEPVFGHDLTNSTLPSFWTSCTTYLAVEAVYTEGIFRISPRLQHLQILRECFDRDQTLDLSEYGPHVVAASLKLFLRLLPTPPLPYSLMEQFPDFTTTPEDTIKIANSLSPQTVTMFNSFVPLLRSIAANEPTTRMSIKNLARCITPSLIRVAVPIDETMPVSPTDSMTTLVPSSDEEHVISDPLEIARVIEYNTKVFECIIYYWIDLPIASSKDYPDIDRDHDGRLSRKSSSSTLRSLGKLPPPLPSRKYSAPPSAPSTDASEQNDASSPASTQESASPPPPEFLRPPPVAELEDGTMSKSVTFSYTSKLAPARKSAPSLVQSRRGSAGSAFSYSSSSGSSVHSLPASVRSLSSVSSIGSDKPFIPVPTASFLLQTGRQYENVPARLPKIRPSMEGKENGTVTSPLPPLPPLPPKVKIVKPRGRIVEELTRLYEERMQSADLLVEMGRRSASV
ncbi:hypothetical protein V1512DRAFT_204260 [Lipomyces arxii]|uniref:uncharacterized protein n=1 Tax=Lipomyces arxii TaxID=56418 RepID=UPI0034D01B91